MTNTFPSNIYEKIRWDSEQYFLHINGGLKEVEYHNLKQKINKHITLKFEDKKTNIYVSGKYFAMCKFLIMNLDPKLIKTYEKSPSLDHITDHYRDIKGEPNHQRIKPKEAFWGHCSNFQAWVENDYNTDIMDRKLAFPILRRLAKVDPKAKQIFKEEIIHKLKQGYGNTVWFLVQEKYLDIFTWEELKIVYEDVKTSKPLLTNALGINRLNTYYYYRETRKDNEGKRHELLEYIAKRQARIKKYEDSLAQMLIVDFLDGWAGFSKEYKNKHWLTNQLKTYTVTQIAKKCTVSRGAIYYWIKKYKIKVKK